MEQTRASVMESAAARELAEKWWVPAVRGVAAVVFGVLTFVAPGITLIAMVIAFGCYALVDGVSNLALAIRHGKVGQPWGALVFAGVAGVVAGSLALMRPGISALALMLVIAAWAIVIGISQIVAAVRLRKAIRGEWLLGLTGLLAIAFGVLALRFPQAGALAVVFWIGAWALVTGALLLGLALKLRAYGRSHEPQRREPHGGLPAPA